MTIKPRRTRVPDIRTVAEATESLSVKKVEDGNANDWPSPQMFLDVQMIFSLVSIVLALVISSSILGKTGGFY